MRKTIISSFLILISWNLVFAQDSYRLTIKQAFPVAKEVYKNSFDFKRELDNAISSQSSKYKGDDKNYTLLITTPSGKETRYIQNINWIQTVNGEKTYHKSKTSPSKSYNEATIWIGSLCNIDGTPKGKPETYEYIYRVSDIVTHKELSEFLKKEDAITRAKELYDEHFVENALVGYSVYAYNGQNRTLIETFDNQVEYKAFLVALEEEKERKRILRLEEQKRLAIIKSVEEFKVSMTELQSAKDTLPNIDGVSRCVSVLEKSRIEIPDSTFVKEKLDSVYRSVIVNDYLSPLGRRKIKPFQQQYDCLKDDSISSRDSLLKYSRHIEHTLLSTKAK